MAKNYVIVGHDGIACPRCERPTQIREHAKIGERQLRGPFYFTRWFYCTHPDCVVTLHIADQFRVWNDNPRGRALRADIERRQRMRAIEQQLLPPV